VILAFGGALLATVVTAIIPLVQRQVIDHAIVTHTEALWPLACLLVGAALLNFLGVYLRRFMGGRLALDVQHDLRTEMFAALSRLDGARQDELHTGQVVSRSISDISMVQGLLGMVPMLAGSALLFVLSIVIMAFLSPVLTLVALAVGPALWYIAIRARSTIFPASWHAQQSAGEVAGVVESAVTGVRVVKGFGQEERELERLEDAGKDLYASRVRTVRLTARYNPALEAVPALGQVGVLILGGWLAIHGSVTLGTFLAFSSYLAQMVGPVRFLTGLITIGQQARASVIRVYEVIDSRPVISERPDAIALTPESSGIELDDVRFGYVPSQPVLNGLTLGVEPGETLALVGTAGSGKSTISLLLPRFYDVRSGVVRVGGHDVRELTLDSLRAAIGLVMEDSFLFSDTISANIGYGRPGATQEQVVAAARAAEADGFIRAMPDGYDTVIGEQGLTLSGGQRQRVALARALITDPQILLLDDATSSVDAHIEAEIHATLRSVMRGRTTILIAHRRSTLDLADRVAVLDEGRVVDVGTHEELTERCPLYQLLLAGPGDDAEGIDAGTLPAADGERDLWPPVSDDERPRAAVGRGGGDGMLAGLALSPELMAKLDKLPPATEQPAVERRWARAADRHFTLTKLLRPFMVALLAGLILDGLDALASLALPALVRGGIDHGVEAKAFHAIVTVSLIGFAIVAGDWIVTTFQTVLVGRNGERLLYALRVKIYAQLQRLGMDFFERELSGRIMTRMTTDVDALSTFLQTGLITMVNSILTFVGVMVALLLINVRLGLTVLAIVPIVVAATVVFRVKSRRAYDEAREKVSIVNADLQENVAGLRTTQAYRREEHNQERFAGRSDSYRRSRVRAQRYIALYFPFLQAVSTVAGALVLFVAAGQVRSGALTAGALIAYLLYVDMLFSPVQQLSQVFDGYQQAAVGLRRIKDLLRIPTSTPPAANPRPVELSGGRLELRDLTFRYQGANRDALTGVNLTVRAGETVALVGETGAGKSTLVKLVARFYDPTAGQMLADGTDVREFELADYRHRLGVVPQEAYLFPGTVRDAIAYGRPDATNDEVEAAARAVGAHQMIARLPGGYHHEVGERGRNLSAGQRQLIALARAYLVDPVILLLDEATAALDLATEAAVTRATEHLSARRTTLVVAHRLTTAARADRIIVLDGGRIVEEGRHGELLTRRGAYAALWADFTAVPAA
jgi:ATP-binding cassette subfamily B protein